MAVNRLQTVKVDIFSWAYPSDLFVRRRIIFEASLFTARLLISIKEVFYS